MLVYSPKINSRLQYVLQFLGEQWLGRSIAVSNNAAEAAAFQGKLINYSNSKIRKDELQIVPIGLLDETGIKEWPITIEQQDGMPYFFATKGDYPFDIFSAIFYLLSRYEEYLPHTKDSYGRYAHTNSIAFKHGFLHRPLINEWLNDFGASMTDDRWPMTDDRASMTDDRWRMTDNRASTTDEGGQMTDVENHASKLDDPTSAIGHRPSVIGHRPSAIGHRSSAIGHRSSAIGHPPSIPFTFLPTYDIDSAWSYRHKGFWRNKLGAIREFFTGKWKSLSQRLSVWLGGRPDPFDVFGWLNQLHEKYQLKPYYFFLFAPKRGKYDKNIDPGNKAMQALVHDHAIRYPVGIHPSWKSGDEQALLAEEIRLLSKATGTPITASRQHYIRMELPQTYRQLLETGIRFDFSMGYGSINGFRASVALPFYWYDLEKESTTELLLFPFCFMEANSYFEQKQSAAEGLAEMQQYYDAVKRTGGLFCMIWHNSFLTNAAPWAEWRQGYESFLQRTKA